MGKRNKYKSEYDSEDTSPAAIMDGLCNLIRHCQAFALDLNFTAAPSIDISIDGFKKALPDTPCVYFVLGADGQVVYVGKTVNLRARWGNHHCLSRAKNRTDMKLAWLEAPPAFLAVIEAMFILSFKPEWNQNERTERVDFFLPHDPHRTDHIRWDKIDPDEFKLAWPK